MSQVALLQHGTLKNLSIPTTPIPKNDELNKYQSSSLKMSDARALVDRLDSLMAKEQLYLRSKLFLSDVARQLNTNTKYLSQAINLCCASNFHQYINEFRVKEIKRKLDSKDHMQFTYFGIAQKCGFKNKSTFYKVFKDLTGVTPGEYIEHI